MPAIMHDHLTALLDAGYEVTLQSGGSVDSDEYYAHVRLGGGPLLTGEGKTPAEALWTASPLHGDDEPMPQDDAAELCSDVVCRHAKSAHLEHADHDLGGYRQGCAIPGCKCMAYMAQPGIDSHVWDCAKCGGQCIGAEPADSVCRGCGGA